MNHKILHISVATTILISSSVNAFFGSDLSIKKERPAVAPEWLKKNDNEVTREQFVIRKSTLPAVNRYIAESKKLANLRFINFNELTSIDPSQLSLTFEGPQAQAVQQQYVKYINDFKAVLESKVSQRKLAIVDTQRVSEEIEAQIIELQQKQLGYQQAVQAVYDLKENTIQAQQMSEQAVMDFSTRLATQLSGHEAIPKPLKAKYFVRPKMKEGSCEDAVITKSTSVQLGYELQGFCFSSKIKVAKNSAERLLQDASMMSEIESKLTAIAQEKIKQGDTFKKQGGVEGYKQQIKAFSYGGIEDVKKSAKQEFGNTDKGFSYKIKSLNKELKSNNSKLASQNKRVNNVPLSELKGSPELQALKPIADQLDQYSALYLNDGFMQIIGKSIKMSSEEYQVIELDESEHLIMVKDSYPGANQQEIEWYLINPSILLENKAIKKHYDGKNIPTTAAARVNGLLYWQGSDYLRITKSIAHFLPSL